MTYLTVFDTTLDFTSPAAEQTQGIPETVILQHTLRSQVAPVRKVKLTHLVFFLGY